MGGAIGIIGGTGIYSIPGLEIEEELSLETPFGKPSSPLTIGKFGDSKVIFITRHGRGHTLTPTEVNYRANIFALKQAGAEWCIAASAVGSLRENIHPGDLLLPDQLIDRTHLRDRSFFGEGVVGHVPFADPFCPVLRSVLAIEAKQVMAETGGQLHEVGTYLCIEGPTFSTRAESQLYRSWGASVIGMTNGPEARLAREAEIAYATIALVTDYDCWRSHDADIDISELLMTLTQNSVKARKVIELTVPRLKNMTPSQMAANALQYGILTAPGALAPETVKKLGPLIGKYVTIPF